MRSFKKFMIFYAAMMPLFVHADPTPILKPRIQIIEHWLKVSSDWIGASDTSSPFFGANCAGAVLLGLGLADKLSFVSPETMDKEILPQCFTEVNSPRPGDIASFNFANGESFHFNLIVDKERSFNKMDITAKFELLDASSPFSCIDIDGTKRSSCQLFRYVGGSTCGLTVK